MFSVLSSEWGRVNKVWNKSFIKIILIQFCIIYKLFCLRDILIVFRVNLDEVLLIHCSQLQCQDIYIKKLQGFLR